MKRCFAQPSRCVSSSRKPCQRAQSQPPSIGVACRQDRQVTGAAAPSWQTARWSQNRHSHQARVLGDLRGRPGGEDDARRLREEPLGGVRIGADALDMQIVIVLADGEVDAPA